MQKGILGSLLVLITSLIWYGYWAAPLENGGSFGLPTMYTQDIMNKGNPDLDVQPLASSPLNAECGNGYCDGLGESDWTSFSCCAEDCGGSCLYEECISPRGLVTKVPEVPFSYEHTYTCNFPDNYMVNHWRLKIFVPNKQDPIYTERHDVPEITVNFYSIGTYDIICQGEYYLGGDQAKVSSESDGLDEGVIDGCLTTSEFVHGEVEPQVMTIMADEEPLVQEDEIVACGDTRSLPEVAYLRDRLIGETIDEVCWGTFYHSPDLPGVAGICCPAGQVCDYNCDNIVDTRDLLLLEQIREGEVQVELPGDGIDNTCNGMTDCGENPPEYCQLEACSFDTFETQEILIMPSDPDIISAYQIEGQGDRVVLAVTKMNLDGQHFLEVLHRNEGDQSWISLGYIEQGIDEEITLKGLDLFSEKEYYLSYQLTPSGTFKIKKFKYGLWTDISPNF